MTKSLRFFFRLVSHFIDRHRRIIFAGFILGIFFFIGAYKLISVSSSKQETRTIGVVGRYTVENIPEEIQNLLSYGLTKIDKNGTPIPGLAKEWKIENEGKTYIFTLKNGLYWHDKTPLKAQDINYNFKDATTEIVDNSTIKFILKEPFAPFPTIVSRPIFKKGLIGIGQYKVKKITRNGQFIESMYLESIDKQNPDIKYRFYPTEEMAKTGLKLGEVKTLKNINDTTGFDGWKNIEIVPKLRFDQYVALFFNTGKSPFDDKTFRQALAYAIPKKEGKERAISSISPLSWAHNSDIKTYDYDLKKAKDLLSKVLPAGKEISIKISAPTHLMEEAEEIAKAWETLGIKVSTEVINNNNNDMQVLLAIQEVPADPDQYAFWHSTQQIGNVTNFNQPRIDKLLEDGRKTYDIEQRKKIYFDFQRFLNEELPAIFLFYPTAYEISRK